MCRPDSNRRSRSQYASVAVALLAGAIWGLIQFFTPVMTDDLVFMAQYLAFNDGDPSFSPEALADFALYNRAHDNFRIANMLAPFSTLFRPWSQIFPVVTAIASALLVWLSARLGRGQWPGWKFQSAVWLLIAIFLPMRAGIFIRDYSLNYIYASALTLFTAFYIIKCESNRWPGLSLAAALLLAVLSGGWHEAPAFALSAGIVANIIVCVARHRAVSWQLVLVTVTLIASVLAFLLCPGMLGRASRELGSQPAATLVHQLYDSSMIIILLATLLAASALKRWRVRLVGLIDNPAFIIFGCSAFAGGVLATLIIPNQRAAFWPQLSAIIALCLFWQPWRWPVGIDAKRYIASAVLALCLLHGLHVVAWQRRFYDEDKIITRLYQASPHGTVFTDSITLPGDVPKTTLSYPSKLLWLNQLHYHQFRFLNPDKPLAVVPASLRMAAPANSRPLLPDSTLFATPEGDLFALPGAQASPDLAGAHLIYRESTGDFSVLQCFANSFVTDLGDTLVYIKPFATQGIPLESIEGIAIYPYTDPFRGDPSAFAKHAASEAKPN